MRLKQNVSTHTPLAGRDNSCPALTYTIVWFLLTRPSRGVTKIFQFFQIVLFVSTHTPLAGRDLLPCSYEEMAFSFYSHAPRGA